MLTHDSAPVRLRKPSLFHPVRSHFPLPHPRIHILVVAPFAVKRASARSSASGVPVASAYPALRCPSEVAMAEAIDPVTLQRMGRASLETRVAIGSASRGTG